MTPTAGKIASDRRDYILDLVERECRETIGVHELPQDFLVWVEVTSPSGSRTSRGIRPTREWVEAALTEKLGRQYGDKLGAEFKIVKANR